MAQRAIRSILRFNSTSCLILTPRTIPSIHDFICPAQIPKAEYSKEYWFDSWAGSLTWSIKYLGVSSSLDWSCFWTKFIFIVSNLQECAQFLSSCSSINAYTVRQHAWIFSHYHFVVSSNLEVNLMSLTSYS